LRCKFTASTDIDKHSATVLVLWPCKTILTTFAFYSIAPKGANPQNKYHLYLGVEMHQQIHALLQGLDMNDLFGHSVCVLFWRGLLFSEL